jgi:predicted metal-dependent hydrolase
LKSEERRAVLPDGAELCYILKRSPRRRTIALRIDGNGLTVNAPARTPLYRLEAVLADKADWVRDKLAEMLARQAPEKIWQDGEILPFLGGHLRLTTRNGKAGAPPLIVDAQLLTEVLDVGNSATVKTKVLKWYRRQALEHFAERVAHYAGRLGVPLPKLFLSNAASRWGSCNSRGEVRLNWRLIKAAPHLIDYVVAHELAHLKHLNHSPAFWRTVALLYPDCLAARRELKACGHRYHDF